MTDEREEALRLWAEAGGSVEADGYPALDCGYVEMTIIEKLIRLARQSAPQWEPVAYRYRERINCGQGQWAETSWKFSESNPGWLPAIIDNPQPLYASPPAQPDADVVRDALTKAREWIACYGFGHDRIAMIEQIDAALQPSQKEGEKP